MPQKLRLDGPRIMPRDGGGADQVVILLHGVGADGNDLIGLAPYLETELPRAVFIAPNAPFAYDMAPFGFQWFSLRNLNADTRLSGVQEAAPALDAFIDEQLSAYRLKSDRLVLLGFSQGAMMALHVGLRRQPSIAGIVSHSGMLVGAHLLAKEIKARPPVLLTHGALDDVLPVQALPAAEATLGALAIPVEAHIIPGLGHGIDLSAIDFTRRFLATAFRRRLTTS